jgi:hypothetical protein
MPLEASLTIKNMTLQKSVKKVGPASTLVKPQRERNALEAIMRYSSREESPVLPK